MNSAGKAERVFILPEQRLQMLGILKKFPHLYIFRLIIDQRIDVPMQKIDLDQGGEGLEKVPGGLAGQVGGGRVGDADLQVILLTSSSASKT